MQAFSPFGACHAEGNAAALILITSSVYIFFWGGNKFMRKCVCILIIMSFVLAAPAIGQPPDIAWSLTLGDIEPDNAFGVLELEDGGFVVVGSTFSYGGGLSDVWLLKLSEDGQVEWEKTFGGTDFEWGHSIVQTQDGGFLIAGGTYSGGSGGSDIWLLKTDSSGELLWDRTYGGIYDDAPAAIQVNSTGDIFIVGETGSFGAGSFDIWLLQLDSCGTQILSTTYGDQYCEVARDLILTDDGSCVILGDCNPYGASRHLWLFEVDSGGDVVWETTHGFYMDVDVRSLCVTPEDEYMVTGSTAAYSGNGDVWLVRLDLTGTVLWDSVFGGPYCDKGFAGCVTPEGDYLIGGSYSPNGISFDFYLLEVDRTDGLEWQAHYGTEMLEEMFDMILTSDGGCIMVGYTQTKILHDTDLYIIKTEPLILDPQVRPDPPPPPDGFSFRIYPNPPVAASIIFLEFQLPVAGSVHLELYDLRGRRVSLIADQYLQAGVHTLEWNIASTGSPVPAGTYFLKMNFNEIRLIEKLVILQ